MKRFAGITVVVGLALIFISWGGSGVASSSADLLKGSLFLEHIRYLASDELVGRGNGSDGLAKAGDYVASQFRELGLIPSGEGGSYFQPFTITLDGTIDPQTTLTVEGAGFEGPLRIHEDYEPMTFTGSGNVEAPVVFVGYGITAPGDGYDDYQGIDVAGKIVLLLRHVPREGRPDTPFDSDRGHATFVTKAVNAKAHGAAGFLLVNDPLNHLDEPDNLVRFGNDLGAQDLGLPVIHIKRFIAERLFEKAGQDLVQVQKGIDEELRTASFEVPGSMVRMNVDVTRSEVEVKNVLGYLPPSEPVDKEEFLIIGGHYDHLGFGERHSNATGEAKGQIHNGADDNASGTAGVIELARVFAMRTDLKRGVLFIAFAGEELGLLGSSYYTKHPTLPLEETVAMLNLDMIGRLRQDKLYIAGVDSSPAFQPKLDEIGLLEGLSFSFNFSGYTASDHTSFKQVEIPSLFFFTGMHGDYHQPTDDWQEIDAAGGERVLRVAYQMADYLQALPEQPSFVPSARTKRQSLR